jgi:hypothetical protein
MAQATVSRPPCEIVPFDVITFRTGEVVMVDFLALAGGMPRAL